MGRGLKTTEKIVFKAALKKDLAGIFQQGFPVCLCKTANGNFPLCNTFSNDPRKVQLEDQLTCEEPFRYTFCARMTISISDIKENGFGALDSRSSDSFLYSHHTNQVYPEFLIIFKP